MLRYENCMNLIWLNLHSHASQICQKNPVTTKVTKKHIENLDHLVLLLLSHLQFVDIAQKCDEVEEIEGVSLYIF